MDGESTNMQMGFSGGAAGEGGGNPVDSTPAASDVGTSTTEGSAAEGGNGSIPPASAAPAAEKTIASSEKGSFKLVYNERTGRNEVVSTMPEDTGSEEQDDDGGESDGQHLQQQADPNAYQGDELLKTARNIASGQQPAPTANSGNEYTLEQLQEAMQVGHVDESRIPVNLRQGYYLARAGRLQQQAQQPAQQPEQNQGAQGAAENTAIAQDFYKKVNEMAQERAMKEIGITQEEIDLAEYTDNEEVLTKFSTYKSALENHKSQILREVDTIQRNQAAAMEDSKRAYQAVVGFVQEMRQKDKNFNEIDKYVLQRVDNMPHKEAAKIVPLIEKVRSGRLTTADLPALQEMYNQARLEYYSKKNGVGLAPQPTKPAYVEPTGSQKEPPKQPPSLDALGSMNRRDKMRAIGQLVGQMFSED